MGMLKKIKRSTDLLAPFRIPFRHKLTNSDRCQRPDCPNPSQHPAQENNADQGTCEYCSFYDMGWCNFYEITVAPTTKVCEPQDSPWG